METMEKMILQRGAFGLTATTKGFQLAVEQC